MSKYVDSEKLITEIEKWSDGKLTLSLLTEIKGVITSLQQEQPEVELEKEIEDYWEKICDNEFGELIPRERETAWFDDIARHFYELGRTAK